MPEREAVHPYLTGLGFARLNAQLQGLADPDAAARPGDRHGRPDRSGGPADRHLFEGDAPAGQAGRRAGPRPDDAAARRAVQRPRPTPAAAHDGAAALDGGPGPDDPVLIAHPRRGRAARGLGARRLRRPARGGRRLPLDPAADDRPAAHLHGQLVRRPAPGRGADGRCVGLRRRARRRAASPIRTADYDGVHARAATDRARERGDPSSRSPPPTICSRASSATWSADERHGALIEVTLRGLLSRRRTILLLAPGRAPGAHRRCSCESSGGQPNADRVLDTLVVRTGHAAGRADHRHRPRSAPRSRMAPRST